MLKCITAATQMVEYAAAKIGAVYALSEKYYKDMVQSEAELAGITSDDNVLCIGGGCCPISAILLHQATGAKVTVIDNREFCAERARKAVERMGLVDYIKVRCCDGCADFPFAEFSVIHIAVQVNPIERVFAHVEKHAALGTKLLMRRPKEELRKLYNQDSREALRYNRFVTHKARNTGSTLLYVKNDLAAYNPVAV